MSQTTAEPPLTPAEIAKRLNAAEVTCRQWITVGLLVPDGPGRKRRVKLKATRAGGRWKVSPDDLAAFLKITTEAFAGTDAPPPPTATEAKRRKRLAEGKAAAAAMLGD